MKLRLKILIFFIIVNVSLYADCNDQVSDQISGWVKRIRAHLTVHDEKAAWEECVGYLSQSPDSQELNEVCIQALAAMQREKELILFTQNYFTRFPEKKKDREILEHLSWGIIDNASSSNAPLVRVYALIAGFFSNDAKGVRLIQKALIDSNSFIRATAIKVSSSLSDLQLQQEVKRLIKEEPNFLVRLEAIKAIGLMKGKFAKNDLEQMIADEQIEHEERAYAIESLSILMDSAKREEIEALSKSKRVGFRLLACELVLSQGFNDELTKEIDLIIPLLKDNHREVRRAALEILGVLQVKEFKGQKIEDIVSPLLKDLDSKVAMTASYIIILNNKDRGHKALKPFFDSPSTEERCFASAVLAKSGKYALPLISQVFDETKDTLVKMNLSLGLIGQRENTKSACNALYLGLKELKEPLVWVEVGEFKYLTASTTASSTMSQYNVKELIPNEKEAMNQLVRLEILNILSIMQFKQTESAIKEFLQESTWGISSMASFLLLTEGDEAAIERVQHLLKDPNEKVRVQAALILSLWSQGDDALPILEEAYPLASREMKERILEGIGRIGSFSSVPFLLECLKEPFQLLRVIAASSLLQILYH